MDILIFSACFLMIALASRQIGAWLVRTGLPLVSGFLLTGIVAGPYCLDLITRDAALHLRFVDEIALGFIAFAAGSELYLAELRKRFRSIAWITAGLVLSTFVLTGLALFFLSGFIPFMKSMEPVGRLAISLIAGAILVARSPSSAIAIVNELRAKGPFTQTVLGVTVIMDVVVIVLFAANSSVADALLSGLDVNLGFAVLLISEICLSLAAGWVVSRLLVAFLSLPVSWLIKAAAVFFMGYTVFITASGIRSLTHEALSVELFLEPLLICMVAGFLVANRSPFRNEFSRILNDAGPPVYIAFFTLTGASLALDVLLETWAVALTLFGVRILAIFVGSFSGGTLAGNPMKNNLVSWMAFITQAGVGLGLAKEVAVEFPEWGLPFSTVIIAVIVLNQLVGPPLFKAAIKVMGEDHSRRAEGGFEGVRDAVIVGGDGQAMALAASLLSQGWHVTVAVTHASDKGNGPDDIPVHRIPGLGISELRQAGCHRAGAIVAMLSDSENFTVCEIAYEHFGTQTLIARLNDRKNFGCFQALGVLIVDPSTAIVSLLDHFVRSPAAASLFMGMHRERKIVDLPIKNPDLAGLALRDLRLPLDTTIMSVRRRGVLFIPHDYTRLEAGDLVTVMGSLDALKAVALRFDVNQEEAMLQIVEKAVSKDLTDRSMVSEVKDLIAQDPPRLKDRFDLLVENGRVMDLSREVDREVFFDAVSEAMAGELGIPASELKDRLMERERDVSTVLAPGLAVPHIIIEGTEKFSILIVRCKEGIVFESSLPRVHAAFVLVGTRDERRFHLRALSAIAQIVLDPRFEKKWLRAKGPQALKQVVLAADRRRDA